MKFCGRQARVQKLMPPRHKATDPYRRTLYLSLKDTSRNPTFMAQSQGITLKFDVTVTIKNDM